MVLLSFHGQILGSSPLNSEFAPKFLNALQVSEEVSEMEAAKKSDDSMTSPAAFVEGGVQEACDDACSICLEDFSESDPSTVTNCRHEFHFQCILEWCQRSSNCPMCWQPISLKDAASQVLLDAVEQEKKLKSNNGVLQHPTHGDFGLQHLTLAATEAEFEERILQHLAAAVAMRGGPHYFLRGGQRNGSSSQADHPYFISTAPDASHGTAVGGQSESVAITTRSPSVRQPNSPGARELPVSYSPVRPDQSTFNRAGSNVSLASRLGFLSESRFGSQSSPQSEDTAGPSDLQSLSESLRSRFNTWSTRYRESFSRNTRGWKERLFARSTSSTDLSPEAQREVGACISGSPGSTDSSSRNNFGNSDRATHSSDSNVPTCAASSASD